jgi:glutamate-1-semialdehyde aminotransferase
MEPAKRALEKSRAYLERARALIPRQAQTLSRAPTQFIVGVTPYMLERGDGCHVWDVDGNKYIDFTCSLGPIILGYNHPSTNAAVKRQLDQGLIFGLPHPLEVECTTLIREFIPSAEMVRFGLNGSDCTTAAIRAARAYTGRDHIAKCGYHGWHDWSICTNPARAKGVPQQVSALSHEFKYNDLASLQKILDDHPGQIAAVVMEAVHDELPKDGFLQGVQELARKHGAVFILDEVLTGFRLAKGGAAEYFKITPDLGVYGKAVSNGMPLSFVAGKKEIMQKFEEVFFSYTYGGEPLALAAAIDTMKFMKQYPVHEHLWKVGRMFFDGYNMLAQKYGLRTQAIGTALFPTLTFKAAQGNDDRFLKSLFFQETVKRGILTSHQVKFSYAHKEEHIKAFLQAVEEAFKIMAKAVQENAVEKHLEGPPVAPRGSTPR